MSVYFQYDCSTYIHEKSKESVLSSFGKDFEIADKQGVRIMECSQSIVDEIHSFQRCWDEYSVNRLKFEYDELLLDLLTHPGDLNFGVISLERDSENDTSYTGDYAVIERDSPPIFGIINSGAVMLLRKSKEKGPLNHIAKYAYLKYFMKDEFANILDERKRRDKIFEMIFNMNIDSFDESLGEGAIED